MTVRQYRAVPPGAATRQVRRTKQGPDRAGVYPIYDDSYATATVVVDDPRQPSVVPIGVYNAQGYMMCRVTIPIKQPMGFHRPWQAEVDDEVYAVLPENMIRISDCGAGIGDISEAEMEGDEFDQEDADYAEG